MRALARRRPKEIAPPKVSVCIPAYNSAGTIERSIDSVLDQTFGDFECVVVDNDSSDDTIARVRRYTDPRIRLVHNRKDVGLVGNHNKCVAVSRAPLIQFVHDDDWLLPDCLEQLVPMFDAENVGLAFAPRHVVTDNREWKARYGRLEGPLRPLRPVNRGADLIDRYLAAGADGNPIGEPTSVMFRREILIGVGGFRPEVPQLQDIDAWLRMLTRCDAAFIDRELSVRWHHSGNATDMFAGTPTLDQMWVLTDLVHSADLHASLRLRALALWSRAFARCPKAILSTPRDQRLARLKKLSLLVRALTSGPRLSFAVDPNG